MVIKLLALLAWGITGVLGVFVAAGLLAYFDGVRQDYSPELYAAPLFLLSLTLARAVSRHAKTKRGRTKA